MTNPGAQGRSWAAELSDGPDPQLPLSPPGPFSMELSDAADPNLPPVAPTNPARIQEKGPVEKPSRPIIRAMVCGVVLLMAGAVVGAGLVGWFQDKPLDDLSLVATPVFTLAGAAVTFYFTEKP